MTLLREIQAAAIDANIEITVLLRKCKVLAARLKNEQFKKWVEHELNGYEGKDQLPSYRIFQVESKGHFSGPFGSGLNNANIPLMCLPEEYRESFGYTYAAQPVSAYQALINSNSEGGSFQEPWSNDFIALVGRDMYQNMSCMAAWKVIPYSSIVSLLDAVRNRILSFVLEIEEESPSAGEAEIGEEPIPQDKVTQVFNTTINGNVGSFAEGCSTVNQVSIQTGKIDSLKSYLRKVGLLEDDINDLENSLLEESPTETLGEKTKKWLGNVREKIAKGTLKLAGGVTSTVITQAIMQYLGIS